MKASTHAPDEDVDSFPELAALEVRVTGHKGSTGLSSCIITTAMYAMDILLQQDQLRCFFPLPSRPHSRRGWRVSPVAWTTQSLLPPQLHPRHLELHGTAQAR